jgi:LysM repeat protein
VAVITARWRVGIGAVVVMGSLVATGCGSSKKASPKSTSPGITASGLEATSSTVPSTTLPPTEPPTTVPAEYVVQKGDSLSGIAKKLGVTMQSLMDANHITNPNRVLAGQKLIVPPPAGAATTGAATTAGATTAAPTTAAATSTTKK